MAKGKPRMTLDQVATLDAWGIAALPVVPRQEVLEEAVLNVGGTVETTAVGRLSRVVVVLGGERYEAEARHTNAATVEALCAALGAIPRAEQATLDLGPAPGAPMGEGTRMAVRDLAGMGVTLTTTAMGDDLISRATRDVVAAVNAEKGRMAAEVSAAGTLDVVYSPAIDGFADRNTGDIYADRIVEDAFAELSGARA